MSRPQIVNLVLEDIADIDIDAFKVMDSYIHKLEKKLDFTYDKAIKDVKAHNLRQQAKGISDLFRKHYHHALSATGLKIWAVKEELMLLEKSNELEKGE